MNYHNITHDDMSNGDGLRVVLWVAGCDHHCKNCQNPMTWDYRDGIEFDTAAKQELYEELAKDYISGITFSGGDPLNEHNFKEVRALCEEIKKDFTDKTIWIYSGYTWEEVANDSQRLLTVMQADVFVDGKFVEELKDINYPWAGSTNQRVIDVPKTIEEGKVVLHASR